MTDDDDRTAVKTYVPRYQKEEWIDHADALDMSQSEFVRTMVQAGRRGFDLDPAEGPEGDVTPRSEGLETTLLELLRRGEYLSWDDLLAHLAGNVEDRLDDALEALQREGRVRYSGRHGGYALVESDADGRASRSSDGRSSGTDTSSEDRVRRQRRDRGRRRSEDGTDRAPRDRRPSRSRSGTTPTSDRRSGKGYDER